MICRLVSWSAGRLVILQLHQPGLSVTTLQPGVCNVCISFSSAKFQSAQSTSITSFYGRLLIKNPKGLNSFPVQTGSVSQEAEIGILRCKHYRMAFGGLDSGRTGRVLNQQSHPQLLGSCSGDTSIYFLLQKTWLN